MTMEDAATTDGPVSVSMTPKDVIAEQVRAIELHDGDVLLFEVAEHITDRHMRAFRRQLYAIGEEYGWKARGITAMAFSAGSVEVTKVSTDRIRALEEKVKELEATVERLCEC
jgi:hypothetical protein